MSESKGTTVLVSVSVSEQALSEKGSSNVTDMDMDVDGDDRHIDMEMDLEFDSEPSEMQRGLNEKIPRYMPPMRTQRSPSGSEIESGSEDLHSEGHSRRTSIESDWVYCEGEKPKLDDFQLITTLGTGTFARVWLAKETRSPPNEKPRLFALKVLKKSDVIRLRQLEHIRNERRILSLCRNHPFIVNFVNSWTDYGSLYLLLNYSPGGEIFGYLRRARRFTTEITRFYAAEITSILNFLHENGIVYRDLKPENLLLDAEGHIQLCDFGFAKYIGSMETYTLCGTPEYLAPEVILSRGHSKAVDWWALGVFIYECICGFPPFYDENTVRIYEKILAAKFSFPNWVSEEIQSIVRGLCTKDLSSRLGNLSGGAQDVMNHPFLESIDWRELDQRKKPGPIIPRLRSAEDTSYFDYYEPPMGDTAEEEYTLSMYDEYEDKFRDF